MTKTTVIVCDHDMDEVARIKEGLENETGFGLEIIDDATELVAEAETRWPCVVIVNPDMKGFNEYDICKKLMRDQNIPVLLLVNADSTHRVSIDDCTADDVLTKPVEVNNLKNLINKHMSVHQ
jgi:DNA-binding response OmpR family regulator